jgi:hypothetical protein
MPKRAITLSEHADRAIEHALAGRSRLNEDVVSLPGLSTPTVRHLLNNLCDFPSANYLEVGTWTGSTLVSASYGNVGRFTAVDNFAWSPPTREIFRRVRERFRDSCRFAFHDADCWSPALLRKLPKDVNVYFYDGPHGYEDHYQAFARYDPVLAREFIAVVDDWRLWPIRTATRAAFSVLGYRTLFEREFFTKGHWWNGLFIAVVRKKRKRSGRQAGKSGRTRTPQR